MLVYRVGHGGPTTSTTCTHAYRTRPLRSALGPGAWSGKQPRPDTSWCVDAQELARTTRTNHRVRSRTFSNLYAFNISDQSFNTHDFDRPTCYHLHAHLHIPDTQCQKINQKVDEKTPHMWLTSNG